MAFFDDFTGVGGVFPDSGKWKTYSDNPTGSTEEYNGLYDNKLKIELSSTEQPTSQDGWETLVGEVGDKEVIIKFDDFIYSGSGGDGRGVFKFHGIELSVRPYEVNFYDGSWNTPISRTALFGFLKITKVGDNFSCFIKQGNNTHWEQVGSTIVKVSSSSSVFLFTETEKVIYAGISFDWMEVCQLFCDEVIQQESTIVSTVTYTSWSSSAKTEIEVDNTSQVSTELHIKIPVEYELDPPINYTEDIMSSYVPVEYGLDFPIDVSYGPYFNGKVELEQDISKRTLTETIIQIPVELEIHPEGSSALSALISTILEHEQELGKGAFQFFIVFVPVEYEQDLNKPQICSFVSVIVTEQESDQLVSGDYGYNVSVFIRYEQDLNKSQICSFVSNVSSDFEIDFKKTSVSNFVSEGRVEIELDDTYKVVCEVITKAIAEMEYDATSSPLQEIADKILALFGKELKATTLSNFDFNSFVEDNGSHYGINDQGFYLIGGEDDDGSSIVPKISLDLHKLRSNLTKKLRTVYTESSSKVNVDFDSVVENYTANSSGKVNCKNSHYGKTLFLDFTDFTELEVIEIFFQLLTRR